MNELDQLLKDLSTGSRPVSTAPATNDDVDVHKIEDLMKDLQDDKTASVYTKKPSVSSQGDATPMTTKARPTGEAVPEMAHASLERIVGKASQGIVSNTNSVIGGGNGDFVAMCAACNEAISSMDLAITAIGNTYHQEHFNCKNCEKGLSGGVFFEKGGHPFCEKCMNETFLLPKCAFCNENIRGKCINALDKHWHPDHFFCSQCGKHFPAGQGFLERDGKAYCEEDFYNMFAPKCATCDLPIMDEVVTALGKSFHMDCFICTEPGCKLKLSDSGSFFDHNGKPYCEKHYHAARGSLCASCQKPIVGRCLTAIGKKFHPEHFVCAFCKKQLGTNGTANTATFKDHDGKPYCVACHVKLYG